MKPRRARVAGMAALAFLLSAPLAASAQPNLVMTFGTPGSARASACLVGQPIVDVFVVLRNSGDVTAPSVQLTAADTTDTLVADVANAASIPPGGQITVALHLRYRVGSSGAISGAHLVGVTAGLLHIGPLLVTLPTNFCSVATQKVVSRNVAGITIASPPPSRYESMTATLPPGRTLPLGQRPNLLALVKLGIPANVHNVAGASDCATHVGLIGALVSPDMIRSGDLLLAWEWQPGSGPQEIDGYRVYRVDGGGRVLVATQANKKALTLADLPQIGGYAGHGYAVVAFDITHESDPSSPYCASGGSVAKTVRISANHVRGSVKTRNKSSVTFGGDFNSTLAQSSPIQVGFDYATSVGTFVDGYHNEVRRAALAFDVSGYANRKFVSAKLHLALAESAGQGNNHSCVTSVGTGTEFWWQNTAWLDGNFSIAPTDTGPDIVADVTPLVAPWLRGEPNYGFLLRNDDENLGAFTDKRCRSAYTNPVLELTYY